MRLGWSPSTRAGLLGTGAMLLCPRAPIGSSPPRRRPRTRRGAGVGRSTFVGPPSRASPSSWGRSRACTDLAGRARAPAGASKTGPFDVYRIFTKVPGQRVAVRTGATPLSGTREGPESGTRKLGARGAGWRDRNNTCLKHTRTLSTPHLRAHTTLESSHIGKATTWRPRRRPAIWPRARLVASFDTG